MTLWFSTYDRSPFVGREKSIRALEAVMAQDKQIILVTQKEAALEDPDASGLYSWHCWDDPAIVKIAGWSRESVG